MSDSDLSKSCQICAGVVRVVSDVCVSDLCRMCVGFVFEECRMCVGLVSDLWRMCLLQKVSFVNPPTPLGSAGVWYVLLSLFLPLLLSSPGGPGTLSLHP